MYWASENGTFWNETEYPTPLGKIRVLTSEGENITGYGINASISDAYPFDLILGGNKEIIFASGANITVWDTSLNRTVDQYNVSGDVMKIRVYNIDKLGADDLIISYVAETTSGVEVISGQGRGLWSYRVPLGETLRDSHLANLSEDSTGFLLATDSALYAVEFRGIQPIWEHTWGIDIKDVYKIFPKDLDGDGILDIIVLSGNSAYVYELSETFVKNQIAESYYDSAKELMDTDAVTALDYANKARDIYSEIGDRDQLSRVESLITELEDKVKKVTEMEADSEYSRAVSFYNVNNTKALEHATRARGIYSQIDDMDGIRKCDDLIEKINLQISTLPETTTTETTTLGTSTTMPHTTTTTEGLLPYIDFGGWGLLLAALLFLIPLALIILVKMATRRKRD